MTHTMKLNPKPFTFIESGIKTIELRLFDEKRKAIADKIREIGECMEKVIHIFNKYGEF